MNILQPSALWALAVVPLIVIFYILRPRHRRQVVPSVRLWLQLPSDLEGRPRWRLPVSSLLLLAQLIVAAGLALALARPALPGAIRQHLILLLDTSPTMMATDVSPNRLALAVSNARSIVETLQPDDLVTLITIEPSPKIVATGRGPNAIDQALANVTAAPARGDATSAMVLAAQTAQLSRDTHNRVVILSDGANSDLSTKALGSIAADVSFQQVGGSDDNVGITSLSVRPMIGSTNRFVGFVQVTNYSHQDVKTNFKAAADGIAFGQQLLNVPLRGHVELSLPLPAGTRHFSVGIDAKDKYGADKSAEVLVPGAQHILITIVSSDPGLWQQAFKTIPTVDAKVVAPSAYKPTDSTLTVFSGFVPATLPPGNVALVAPPKGNPIVPVTGDVQNADIVHTDSSSPLFASVDLGGLFVADTATFGDVSWARSVADTSKGPAILTGTRDGRTIIVIGFDPGQTDWPQRISFPVFIANLVDSLSVPPVPTDVVAGSVLDLPPASESGQVLIQLPNGKMDVFTSNGRPVRFTDTGQLGPYQVTYTNGGSPVARQEFVVNRLGVTENNIMPQVDPAQLSQTGGPTGLPSQHDVWMWVAGGALAVIGVEWLAYFSRLGR